jgi:hypothetical protein
MAASDLMVAELQRRCCPGQQRPQAFLPFVEWLRTDGLTVEMEKIEQEKDKCLAVPGVGCILDETEGGGAVGPDAAQLPVEVSLPGRER